MKTVEEGNVNSIVNRTREGSATCASKFSFFESRALRLSFSSDHYQTPFILFVMHMPARQGQRLCELVNLLSQHCLNTILVNDRRCNCVF